MNDEKTSTTDGMAGMMRVWLEMASHAAEAYQSVAGAAISPEVMRQGRSNLYKVWGDYWERFYRSSSFLEAEKQCATQSLDFQKQMRDQLGRLNRELQLANSQDIDQLMIGVRRISEDLREHFEDIEARIAGLSAQLDAIAARLESVEKSPAERNTRPPGNNSGKKSRRVNRARGRVR